MITKSFLCFIFAVSNVNTVASYLNNIEPLNGANFHDWKGKVTTCLAWNDLDIALREDKPTAPAAGQVSAAYDKWERSDRMALCGGPPRRLSQVKCTADHLDGHALNPG